MRFAPTEEQLEFAAAAKALLADTCTPSDVAASWGGEVGRHTELGDGDGRVRAAWDALVEMGVNAILVPEAQGGLEMSLDHLVGVLIECGYSALPDPLADTAGVVAHTLAACEPSSSAPASLESIASGATIVSGFGADPIVAAARTAESLLLFTHDPVVATRSDDAPRVLLVAASDVRIEALESVDGSRMLGRVTDVGSAAEVLAQGDAAAALTTTAFEVAALCDAALLVGLSRAMIDMTVAYATERKQFGVPIGSFQAVKHHLADAALAVQFAEPLVRNAAHVLSGGADLMGQPRSVAVSAAKARASRAAQLVTEVSLQCHGAIGYTVEADLHLFMKRAWALCRSHGDVAFHTTQVRNELLSL